MKVLVVIDMQNDFTTGQLGNAECAAVVEPVTDYIQAFRVLETDGLILATLDTHFQDYMETQEGVFLPVPHCIKGTEGWELVPSVADALGDDAVIVEKGTFGAIRLPEIIGTGRTIDEIQIIGVCTDICVISNAMILKAAFPEVPLKVISGCCAGVTPERHQTALSAMKACQMIIV